MTATSIAPYFDAEFVLVAAGELEVLLVPEVDAMLDAAEVVVVSAADFELAAVDMVVEAVEFKLGVPVAEDLTVPLEDDDEVSAKTPPDEEDETLELTDDAALVPADAEPPLHEPATTILS